MGAGDDTWAQLRSLPLVVESYELDRLSATFAYGFERVTTRIRLAGGGSEGWGEDVSPFEDESATLHAMGPVFPLAGEWTLESFCDHLAEVEQWTVAPEWEMARRWRNWAFESAALDLALNQAGRPLHEVLGRPPGDVRFVNSLGLGDPPGFDPIRRRLEHHPGLRFKLDATAAWTPEIIEEVAATGAVEIVDFKGRYGMEYGEVPALLAMYERVIAAFPDALLEDGHELPEAIELLEPEAGRISYDAPIGRVSDLDDLPLPPRAVNIKPCRVGDLRSLFDLYAECAARELVTYGGGMGELDVGRGQIQLLAAIFHADSPNDVAPSGYNLDTPAPDLPESPLPARPAPTGFRREP
jgi:hypothetical protein